MSKNLMFYRSCMLLLVFISTVFCLGQENREAIRVAIQESNLEGLKPHLKKINREPLKRLEKKRLYYKFYSESMEVHDQRKGEVSLVGSWRDLGAIACGSAMMLSGGIGLAESTSGGRLVGSTVLLGIGSLIFYKGITCSTQQGWVADAKGVEDYLELKFNELK